MIFIIVLFSIAFLLFGYYLMDKVDKFIEHNVIVSSDDTSNKYSDNKKLKQGTILIYGQNELVNKVVDYCNSAKYNYEKIADINQINRNNRYECLLVLSYNDVDNLMTGSVGFKVYCIPHIIAVCNNQNNLKIYKEFNFDRIMSCNDKVDKPFNIIKEFIQNVMEKKSIATYTSNRTIY